MKPIYFLDRCIDIKGILSFFCCPSHSLWSGTVCLCAILPRNLISFDSWSGTLPWYRILQFEYCCSLWLEGFYIIQHTHAHTCACSRLPSYMFPWFCTMPKQFWWSTAPSAGKFIVFADLWRNANPSQTQIWARIDRSSSTWTNLGASLTLPSSTNSVWLHLLMIPRD